MTEEEMEDHDAMAMAYPDYADSHQPLWRNHLQHACNMGEHRVPGSRYSLDGYQPDGHMVCEFHGCFWHGCHLRRYPQCTEEHRRLFDRSMDDAWMVTERKMQFLRERGYRVVEMWECQWNRLKTEDPDVRAFV